MENRTIFPDKEITVSGDVSKQFLQLDVHRFHAACDYVYNLPYGYNTDRDDPMILFKEKMGTCTTKHSVIASLALELNLPVFKNVCIYAMTEDIVQGTDAILTTYDLPYVPMVHCFLAYQGYRVDLTEGNRNGKKKAIKEMLFFRQVDPGISAKEEYLLYRKALETLIIERPELRSITMKRLLQAREAGLALLKQNLM